jgi:hypothetical protein
MNRLLRIALPTVLVMTACGKDATSSSLENPPRGGLPIPVVASGLVDTRYTAEVAVAGGVAYTTTWGLRVFKGNTTYVWDVSGAAPVLTDSLVVEGVSTTGDVQISPDGHYLVIATETANGSIVIYDRSKTPLHPTFVSRYISPHTQQGVHTMKMSQIDGHLYGFLQIDPSTEKARETIIDMTDPLKITEVFTSIKGQPFIHDVFVRDGLLFTALWNDGMTIYDIGGGGAGGTPSAPVKISNFQTATGHIHNIWWFHDPHSGSKKYVFLGEEGPGSVGSSSSGDIHVIDISNITAPKEVATLNVLGAGTHNFWVDEPSGILYAAYYNGGVRAIDIRGDLSACLNDQKTREGACDLDAAHRLVGKALDSGSYYVWGVAGAGNRVYASDMKSGLVVLDISRFKR